MSALLDLAKYGQSYWLDDLSRRMIENGELKRRVTEEGLGGVTDNPAIFNAALTSSDDYDEPIRECAGLHANQIYETLIVADVRDACDILRPVYDRTEGRDGFVSLEVSPQLARDAPGSIVEARRLWKAVDRPNLFIKIPGTPEGVPAIETLLIEGININVTLLFSIESYEAVAHAYVRALERRKAQQEPVDRLASVASFFLSRIDTLVDEKLQARAKLEMPSRKTSSANAPSPMQNSPTSASRRRSHRPAGRNSNAPARYRSDFCGRVPVPRIRRTMTSCTSSR